MFKAMKWRQLEMSFKDRFCGMGMGSIVRSGVACRQDMCSGDERLKAWVRKAGHNR